MLRSVTWSLILFALFFLPACTDAEKKDQKEDKKGMKSEKESSKGGSKAKKKAPILPSTLQVASSFKKAGLPYKNGLIMSPDQVDGLVNPNRKKLAFGAYSADLAYLVINEKENEARSVMAALMKLAEDLNISSVFNTEAISERFQGNLQNRDSLVKLIVEVQQRFDTYVAKNRDRQMRTMAYAGGWSEAMYLAANSEIQDKESLHLEVEEQMTILDKLLKALERDVENAKGPMSELLKELKQIDRAYDEKGGEPGKTLPDSLLKELNKRAENARSIISNRS